ncbi:MAG: PDDEXK nuclease domain-containing protein [Bacteroidetes bacterium]|nr:PDDEXK nuclease domain-containing protein [Bacteroidota bacterium]
MNTAFTAITELIKHARAEALRFVNTELVNLYWNVGAYISLQIANAQWGDKTVRELAHYIQQYHPDLKGFNRSGLYRMIQFYNTYQPCDWIYPETISKKSMSYENFVIVAPLARQLQTIDFHSIKIVAPVARQFEPMNIKASLLAKISWSHHQIILARCKEMAEKEFYIRLSIKEQYSKRDLDRQIDSGVFERAMLGKQQLSPSLKTLHPDILNSVRDPFILEFLNLPEEHNENDLQQGMIRQMKKLILELGKDFLFIGQEYRIQVGNRDFKIDLLFFHRGLQCLEAFELKKEKFEPEHLGKMNFYLEALDRTVKKENEKPSIGILLCKDKDYEVVEFALNRTLSPTMVAEYKTHLPDKKILQQKLHELFERIR